MRIIIITTLVILFLALKISDKESLTVHIERVFFSINNFFICIELKCTLSQNWIKNKYKMLFHLLFINGFSPLS